MKLIIEASPIEQDNPSGVNYFTEWLAKALEAKTDQNFMVEYFYLNFLLRKPLRNPLSLRARKEDRFQQICFLPQRVYAKLVYAHVAPPLPVRESDWVLFPNFYTWPTLRRTKKAVIIHDIAYMVYPEYVEDKNRKFLTRVANRSIRSADLIVSNSEFTTHEIVSRMNVPETRIVTLNIPVDEAQFDKSYDKGRDYLAHRYGITKPYIMSLGTLEPRKNLETIIEAYCLLPQHVRDTYSLVFAGKWGWKIESLRELITAKQAAGFDIITTGHVDSDDRATLYHNASFYTISSYYEGFGMPLLEALYCSLPTVAVDIPVLREVGGDGCVWAKRDPRDLSSKLLDLIQHPKKASTIAQKGKQRADSFSWDKTAETLKRRLLEG